MHEREIFIPPQTLVHLSQLERPAQKGVSPIDPEKQLPEFVSPVGIVEDREGPAVADVFDELRRGDEILIQSKSERFIFLPHPGFRPTAILQRAIAGTADAAEIIRSRFGGGAIFQPHLMPPRNIEIVFVKEPAALAQFQ